MSEDFLHYIWKFRLFNSLELKTADGKSLYVNNPGTHNQNGGPDFLHSMITIDDQQWAGHVEIHINASDWHRHDHTHDEHYKNVILHVVFNNDKAVNLFKEGDLPVFDLSTYIAQNQYETYSRWMKSKTWIPCQAQLYELDSLTWMSWKDRLLIERLELKSKDIYEQLEKNGGDWNETFYRKLARNFGFKVNADAMETLAESIPQSILAKCKSDPFQVEALLFGQSGLLEKEFADEYPARLKSEYAFLSKKYSLEPLKGRVWNFGRIRPANFPTIRIAQFASLICKSEHLFSKVIAEDDYTLIPALFETEANSYWDDHFTFQNEIIPSLFSEEDKTTLMEDQEWIKRSKRKSKKLGEDSITNILINTVAIMLFAYGQLRDDEKQVDKALRLLEICEPEHNNIIEKWNKLSVKSTNASDTQSLLHLFNYYCMKKQCLRCQVGLKLIQKSTG